MAFFDWSDELATGIQKIDDQHRKLIELASRGLPALWIPVTSGGTTGPVTMAGNVVALLVGFHWLNLDSFERGIRRPMWLDIGIVLLAAGFVPYYLYKTRPEGRRGRAIMGFFALIGTCIIASAIGAMAMMSLQGAPPAA